MYNPKWRKWGWYRRGERSQSGEHGYSSRHIGNSVCIASSGQAVSA